MHKTVETEWPQHSDGRPKKLGEMTPEERKAQFKDAALKVKATMETPAMREAIHEYVAGDVDAKTKH